MDIPDEVDTCGLHVEGETQYHKPNSILVFDDSKTHFAFNNSTKDRIVLIIDIMRPITMALGTCVGGHTSELNDFINLFK